MAWFITIWHYYTPPLSPQYNHSIAVNSPLSHFFLPWSMVQIWMLPWYHCLLWAILSFVLYIILHHTIMCDIFPHHTISNTTVTVIVIFCSPNMIDLFIILWLIFVSTYTYWCDIFGTPACLSLFGNYCSRSHYLVVSYEYTHTNYCIC